MKSNLKRNSKYKFILKELRKLYGKELAEKISLRAEKYFDEAELLCQTATTGERQHLDGTILPTVAFYKALLEIDNENAFHNTRLIIINLCVKASKVLNFILLFPCMKSLFMRLLPKMALKMFGRDSGFDYEGFFSNESVLKMDMTLCPYCKYAKLLNSPELVPVFCESDFATYGNLKGIKFTRSQTLGTGGKRCDFKFEKL